MRFYDTLVYKFIFCVRETPIFLWSTPKRALVSMDLCPNGSRSTNLGQGDVQTLSYRDVFQEYDLSNSVFCETFAVISSN
jgi:hypothetical protein